jgi:polar amino acid transport system permease protein
VSLVAYAFSIAVGLFLGLCRTSPHRVVREVSTFWVEIVRGVPMLVILYYIAFIGAPGLVELVNVVLSPLVRAGIIGPLSIRSIDFSWRAIIALTLGYGAFISEIFRAGIESIHAGQWEAAFALGLRRGQAMRLIVLPQAVRNVLPPLGNEFVAMIKDSALVSALGVQDVTQMGKVYAASTFKFFETYNVVAFLYLVLTITLSMLVRLLEKRLRAGRRGAVGR